MPLFSHARKATAVTAVICASALLVAGTEAVAAPKNDPNAASKKFRKAVTPGGIGLHLDAFQKIADANDGTRASGTPGYAASKDYVVKELRAAGYKPKVQAFAFPFFEENTPSTLAQTSPDATTYERGDDFATMTFSGSGTVTDQEVVVVDNDLAPADPTDTDNNSGCEAEDFANFPDGAIALIQRGTCDFGVKAANAEEAGASAALIFNNGTNDENGDRRGAVEGTLGAPSGIPVLGLSFAAGVDLGTPSGTRASVSSETTNETRNTYNVTAETKKGNADRVIMAGAHLDSVIEGPGINDNGSGSATVLEMAQELAKEKKLRNQVRFAWWGAEELGLLGAEHYVADLAENDKSTLDEIGAYLNFDMVGSPNYARFVYDGDNSTGEGEVGPAGSGDIEQLFTRYFTNQRLTSSPTAFDGRSDYGPFIENGVPSGGLFTGAEGVKSPAEAKEYGGVAGVAYDVCYHAACDDRDNISVKAIDEMSDAAAHVLYVLAQNRGLVQDTSKMKKSTTGAKVKAKDRSGHGALR